MATFAGLMRSTTAVTASGSCALKMCRSPSCTSRSAVSLTSAPIQQCSRRFFQGHISASATLTQGTCREGCSVHGAWRGMFDPLMRPMLPFQQVSGRSRFLARQDADTSTQERMPQPEPSQAILVSSGSACCSVSAPDIPKSPRGPFEINAKPRGACRGGAGILRMTLHKPLLEADSSGQRSNMEGQYAVTTASCLHALLLAGHWVVQRGRLERCCARRWGAVSSIKAALCSLHIACCL